MPVSDIGRVSCPTPEPLKRVGLGLWCGLCLILGAWLRCWAAQGELWFDEIYSVALLSTIISPWQIFTLHHDNNHWLYTIFFYNVGIPTPWWLYRLPSIVAGVATIALTALVARRFGRWTAATACLLASLSSFFVYFSSEARGYALATSWALLAFISMEQYLTTRRWLPRFCLVLSIALGFLSHLTFIHIYLALLGWSVAASRGARRGWLGVAQDVVRSHWAPWAFLATLYLIDIRHLRHGGGAVRPVMEVLREVLAIAAGAPKTGAVAVLVSVVLIGVAIYEIVRLGRDPSRQWVFWLGILLIPGVLMGALFDYIYPRHFVVCVPFLLVLWSRFLVRCARAGAVGRLVVVMALALMGWGHGVRIHDLVTKGRGHHLEALRYMADQTKGGVISVGGSVNESVHKVLVWFYAQHLPDDVSVVYHDAKHWPEEGALWFLVHPPGEEKGRSPPLSVVAWREDHRYRLAKAFRVTDLAGWDLFVYRQEGR